MISLTGETRSNLLANAVGVASRATRRLSLQVALITLFALASAAQAQLTFNYDFSINTNIADFGQLTDTRTLGGLSVYNDVTVRLNLTSPDSGNPMYLGDMYSSLTRGGASGRTAVLLNRPGVDNMNPYGSMLTSFNATIDDSATHNVFYASSYYPTETRFQSDGRSGVDPYGSGVAFSPGARDATLSVLNDSMVNSDSFSLLVADTVSGGQARLE